MNTKLPTHSNTLNKLKNIVAEKDAASEACARLQQELDQVKQERQEDRFFFLLISVVIIDAILFIYLVDGVAALAFGNSRIIPATTYSAQM